ncbi:MAG: linear amide C-N hydrolase [Candidatus Marinimicrobia bacterium]|nr:linear amide C-N hydrolase [Candidatus Neomarinimicrobiota bacterium]
MKKYYLLFILLLPMNSYQLNACTIIFSRDANSVLIANNLDYSNCFPRMWIVPATGDQYGRLCFGFDSTYTIAEGGMNDQGLYISVNALDEESGWKSDPTLKDWETWEGWYTSGVPDGILAKCATVEEAIKIFQSYNLFTLQNVKFLIADKSGSSVVVEWSKGSLVFLERMDKNYQISTNFVTSNYLPEEIPCYRYKLATDIFEAHDNSTSVDFLREILSATHLEFQFPTVYSNICDLNTGDVYLYYFHNFEEVVKINVFDKVKSGRAEYLLSDLFTYKPYVAHVYEQYFSGN